MDKIIDFDNFVKQCDYFYTDNKKHVNNGYNCNHPQQKYKEEGIGCCYSWTCPFGHEAEKEDFENEKIDNNGWKKDEDGLFVVYDN